MQLGRVQYDNLATVATRIIRKYPRCADALMQELILFCEDTPGPFKRKFFILAVHIKLNAINRLPKDSLYLPKELEVAPTVPAIEPVALIGS